MDAGDEDPAGSTTSTDGARSRPADGRAGALAGITRCQLVVAVTAATVAAVLSAVGVVALSKASPNQAKGSLRTARQAPTMSVTRLDGTDLSLAGLRGQPVVVTFWTSACAGCEDQLRAAESVQRSVGDRVTFVGIAVRDDAAAAKRAVARAGTTYDVALDPTGTVLAAFGAEALPTTVLVAPDGTIVDMAARALPAGELRARISGALLGGS
ncbi:MAG: TlpA family protein disulfide reductase [Actinobacteria bacterium]|nr:TlpA family protein disulfide reductase [Actinomycetota bacterium]